MKLVCEHCSNDFEGKNEKFCSIACQDSHISSIEKRVRDAVENDPSHTDKLSRK